MNQVPVKKKTAVMPMLALRGLVLFPNMVIHFDVGREKSVQALHAAMERDQHIFLAAQKNLMEEEPSPENIYSVGIVAKVRQILKTQDKTLKVLVEGEYRARSLSVNTQNSWLEAEVEAYPVKVGRVRNTILTNALMRTAKDFFQEYCYLTPKMPKEIIATVLSTDDPVYLVEYIAGNLPFHVEDKQRILNESVPSRRLEMLIELLESENEILDVEHEIYEKVKEQADKNQREYYLREQMKVIANELGEGENVQDEAMEYRDRILALSLPQDTEEKLLKETDRLYKMPPGSQESSVIRNYLDVCLELPWNKETKDKIDLGKAKKQLDHDHFGLEKVKERILEQLAVRSLNHDLKGQILCLYGPPGVGKTSIARSIAKCMGRKYVRMSLGGIRDESDIRGHRKTYIGAMPGRIINAMRQAKTKNPLILLDEIDKIGNDFRGDPASALLEVLDAEQNMAFVDHYIEVPFDLSNVLFLATANNLDTIPAPLLDRMEVIELNSYTREEKFQIAKKYLVPKQLKKHGLTVRKLKISDDALYAIIDFYTREAGVRGLERTIASLARKAAAKLVGGEESRVTVNAGNIVAFLGAKKYRVDTMEQEDQIGVVNGLAWTSVGGEMLQVEVAILEGSGKLELTGSLGEVMKESAHAAVSFIRSCAEKYGIDKDFYKNKDIHIHVPEGAVPKDGPSAGVTICTALVSALSAVPVHREVAMTGEITLRGRVLPIGGLKEKTMAAYRAGMKKVIVPWENESDLQEVDETVKNNVEFVIAKSIQTVLEHALVSGSREEKKPDMGFPIPVPRSGKNGADPAQIPN